MGDKKTSKIKMEQLNVPLIPGFHGKEQDEKSLLVQAKKIGFPVLIKASAGGGGKGMRIVYKEEEFPLSLEGAKREAQKYFGNNIVLIEKFIENPRHIEVQVVSDSHGNHLHLFERECSIQRRYQKIIEESPASQLSDKLKKKMYETAVKISKSIDYLGLGTIEFLVDESEDFYFLEMNTRLQVEHPVTEMVTGLDLVELQIQIAENKKLSFKQGDLLQQGHSIELRVYAENPDNNFLPSIGKILKIGESKENKFRLDCGYVDGNDLTIDFDPMIGKIIVHGQSRDEAIEKAVKSLNDFVFLGIQTNRDYLARILKHKQFQKGLTYTHFVETYKEELEKQEMNEDKKVMAIAGYLLGHRELMLAQNRGKTKLSSTWDHILNFRNV